ncbi:MAG: DUF411 domain-containing protein [Cyanobacteriota bacterium]|nr:DUF411 domain-containing protein [Cyanobacteriota bacterium]
MAIAGIAALTAGGAYLAASNSTPANRDRADSTILASVWDRQTEAYAGNVKMTVYRSPSCGCCGLWIEHAKKHGFQITDIKTENIDAIKRDNNVPENLASCHTTIIDGYAMEGHIPADEIKRFLKQKPQAIGLAVPGMPLGTPGMESGNRKQPFDVLAFGGNGQVEVFASYENY